MVKSVSPSSGNRLRLASRDPFQVLREEMNGLIDQAFGRPFTILDSPIRDVINAGKSTIIPKIDIHETDNMTTLTAELPGVDEKDVDISVYNGVLTLKGEKCYEKAEGEGSARIIERSYGSFERSFTLPLDIDTAKIEAQYDKGVLRLTLPKRPEAQDSVQRISIGKH